MTIGKPNDLIFYYKAEDPTTHDPDVSLLSAQLEEALNQLEDKNKRLINAESQLHSLRREVSAREVATESKDQQFETQVRITTQLQDRNMKLETELAKVKFHRFFVHF